MQVHGGPPKSPLLLRVPVLSIAIVGVSITVPACEVSLRCPTSHSPTPLLLHECCSAAAVRLSISVGQAGLCARARWTLFSVCYGRRLPSGAVLAA
jgi:hypothetical protein